MSRDRAVIFDLDGTLIDSYAPITESLNAARAAHGLAATTVDQVRRQVGRGLETLIASHLGPDRVADGVRIFRERYQRVFAAGTVALAGTPEALLGLARRGLSLAVVSNKPARFGRPIVEMVGLGDVVRVVVGPDSGLSPKPAPDMLLAAAAQLNVDPGRSVYVGDMPLDAEAALNAGMRCILVVTGGASRAEIEAIPGVFAASDLNAAVRLIA